MLKDWFMFLLSFLQNCSFTLSFRHLFDKELEDDSTRVEDAGSKKDWSFRNTSCNCRCSFTNRSTWIIARLFKVFVFYFWKNIIRWGEGMSRLVKKGKVVVGFLSLKGPYFAQQVSKGNFIPLSYKCWKLCISAPYVHSQQVSHYSPVIVASSTAPRCHYSHLQ